MSPPAQSTPREWRRGDFAISDDPARLDLDVVHGYLSRSYWSAGIPREVVARSIAGSLPFGVYRLAAAGSEEGERERQVGFARVISDLTTFAYLADVFVLEEHRGHGLARWLMEVIVAHPDLQGLRRWSLATRDAHGLYRPFGFRDLADPGRHMERLDPDVYRRASGPSRPGGPAGGE